MQVHRAVCILPCFALGAALVPPAGAGGKADKKLVAFFKAVSDGDLAGIQEAVRKNVDLNALDENENTALGIAARAGRADVVDALLKAGARIDQPNGAGLTPVMLAARDGHAELAQTLLAAGANRDAVDQRGRSLLFHAVRGGQPALVQALLAAKANANAGDENGRTPIMLAAEDGRIELVRLLLDAGAGIDARDLRAGQTPLMAAAQAGQDEVVTVLLRAGADPSLKDNDGQTAESLAAQSQHPSTAELLKPRPTPEPRKPSARGARAKPIPKPTLKPTPKP
jgi:ankyrin repeat protein